jgi:hypothetical protein
MLVEPAFQLVRYSGAVFIGGDAQKRKRHRVKCRSQDAKNPAVLSHQPGF